jgi:hypothetical protein
MKCIPKMYFVSTHSACMFGIFSVKLLISALLNPWFRLQQHTACGTLWSFLQRKPTYTLMEQGGAQ